MSQVYYVARRVRAWIETRSVQHRPNLRPSPAACGRGLKLDRTLRGSRPPLSPAACGRGLKHADSRHRCRLIASPAACGRGLKQDPRRSVFWQIIVARRVRAWIETLPPARCTCTAASPAACGRGLKHFIDMGGDKARLSPAACGRGLKLCGSGRHENPHAVARRVRAWIETRSGPT